MNRLIALLLFLLVVTNGFCQIVGDKDIVNLLRLAEQGDAAVQYKVGLMYADGIGVPNDPEKAYYWIYRAAEGGDVEARAKLGSYYATGFGVERDYGQAVIWYGKASDWGSPDGSYGLGYSYYVGQGVEKNFESAKFYFDLAARKNHVPALVGLAEIYSKGLLGSEDQGKASGYLERAAELGDVGSCLEIGRRYRDGYFVTKNYFFGRKWLKKAVDLGSQDAVNELNRLDGLERKERDAARIASSNFVRDLKKKYANRIFYKGSAGRSIVKSFNIDCKIRDLRYLPLENVLLVRLYEHEWRAKSNGKSDVRLMNRIESRGADVRIYDELVNEVGRVENSVLIFELNKWGELRAFGFSLDAVLSSCRDIHGPIYVIP